MSKRTIILLYIKRQKIIQTGQGEIEPKAISEATRTGTTIITRQGVKLIAKKLDIQASSKKLVDT